MDWRKKFAGESLPLPITNLLIAEMSSCSTASPPFCRQWSTRRPPRKVASSTRQSNTMKTRLFEKKELASGVPKPIQEITALLSISHTAGYGKTFGLPELGHEKPMGHLSCLV